MDKTPPFPLNGQRRGSHTLDEPLLRSFEQRFAGDLANFGEREVDTLVEQLRQLESAECRQLASDLRRVFQDAIATGDAPAAANRRDTDVAVGVAASPPSAMIKPLSPSLRAPEPVPPPSVRTPITSSEFSLRLEPELTSALSAEGAAAKRSRPRGRHLGLPLAAAVIAMAIPWNFPVLPGSPSPSATNRTAQEPASSQQRSSHDGEPLLRAPSVATVGVPTASAPTIQSDPAPERQPVANLARGRKDTELLIQQGDRFLIARDVIAARSFYERAAAAGSAAAAFAMARTFDPRFLSEIGATGVRPDAKRAAAWYRIARGAGEVDAQVPVPHSGSHN